MSRTFLPHVITDDSALGGSVIERSFRFNDGSNTHLSRTPSASNRKIWTISAWVKRANLSGNTQVMFHAYDGSSSRRFQLAFNTDNKLLYNQGGNGSSGIFTSNARFRDTSAWYHIVFRAKYTNVLASDRFKVYVNGSEISLSFSDDVENADGQWNGNWEHEIGVIGSTTEPFDGYMAEIHSIDGEALLPTDFGFTDTQTGTWRPKRYEGTYGTNGFYLDFSDNSSITNMMIDKSPNGNDWSPDNCNTEDSMLDTPSNNFCTFIGVEPGNSNFDLAEGNLFLDVLDSHKAAFGTMGLRSGKWYWEGRLVDATGGYTTTKWTTAVTDIENTKNTQTTNTNYLLGKDSATYSHGDTVSIYYRDLYKNGTKVTDDYIPIYATNDIIQMALDVDGGKVWFGRNGTWVNGSASASTTLNESSHDITVTTGKVYTPAFGGEFSDICANFGQDGSFAGGVTAQGNKDESGQGDFYYTVPSGFKAICAANLPITTPSILDPQKHFDTILYTGDGSSNNEVTGLEFKPDLVWIKSRSATTDHVWQDSVRGNYILYSNSNAQEGATGGGWVKNMNEHGFVTDVNGPINTDSATYVAWCWKAGGAAVSNSDGTITSSVSANQESGFSIVTYTGNGSGTGQTVGHGLGKAPKVIFLKKRNAATNWFVYHGSAGNGAFEGLNTTSAYGSGLAPFNTTAPSSTVVTLGNTDGNQSGINFVLYCWAEIPGYSKFGTYNGNSNSDGTYVPLGFRPAWLLVRRESGDHWIIKDSTRSTTNDVYSNLLVNSDVVEFGSTGNVQSMDFLSDGFKLRGTDSGVNGSSNTYIYMAFAEQSGTTPFDTNPNGR